MKEYLKSHISHKKLLPYKLSREIVWLWSYIWFKSLFALSSNKTWLSVGDDGLIVSNVWFMHSDARLQHQLAQSHGKLAQPQLQF